ncbi:MAG: bacterioferritin-associated ferredoxin [Acidobacteriota bacterium]
MIVCMCKGITDTIIRKLVREGASSPSDVGMACSAGRDCGGCRPTICEIVRSEKGSADGSRTSPATLASAS